jgi:hypothetical protein
MHNLGSQGGVGQLSVTVKAAEARGLVNEAVPRPARLNHLGDELEERLVHLHGMIEHITASLDRLGGPLPPAPGRPDAPTSSQAHPSAIHRLENQVELFALMLRQLESQVARLATL